jgi:hypothetical protein
MGRGHRLTAAHAARTLAVRVVVSGVSVGMSAIITGAFQTNPFCGGQWCAAISGCERSWQKLRWRHLQTSLPPWRRPFHISLARVGFVGENLFMLGLQRRYLWRCFLLEGVTRLFSTSAPLFRSCRLAMTVFGINVLGWLPELVIFAS